MNPRVRRWWRKQRLRRDAYERARRELDHMWTVAWREALQREEIARGVLRAQVDTKELARHFSSRQVRLLGRLRPEIDVLAANNRAADVLMRWLLLDAAGTVLLGAIALNWLAPPLLPDPSGWTSLVTGLAFGLIASDAGARVIRRRRIGAEHARLLTELRAKLDGLLVPQLRRLLNELLHVPFDVLDVREATGLSEVVDPSLEVPTRAREQLVALLRHMSSGSVGISGLRGAGKTTLIRAACQGRLAGAVRRTRAPLGVWVSAPVRWEASDFIPFLFGEVCGAVAPWLRDTERYPPARRRRDGVRLGIVMTLAIALFVLSAQALSGFDPLEALARRFEVLGLSAATAAATVAAARLSVRFANRTSQPLWQLAERRLWDLRYRETVVRGWSVGAKPGLLGLSFGRKREATATEQPMTLPEVIGRYKGFIERITREQPVVIGIDELDKMDSAEDAARFLRDVKVLFGQPRCFYLVSVSDDAMSEFERRGMPMRNVFDSSFDDVLHVEPLSHPEAQAIVNGRVVGMGDAYIALCYMMSGGLPRELIRCTRAVVALADMGDIAFPAVVWTVVAERLGRMVRGVEAVASQHIGSDGRQPLLDWLVGLPPLAPGSALEARWDVAQVHHALDAHPDADVRDMHRVMLLELAVSAYRTSTIVELCDGFTQEALDATLRKDDPSPGLDLLAQAWLDLSRGPVAAWKTVDRAREEIGLPLHPFPIEAAPPAARSLEVVA